MRLVSLLVLVSLALGCSPGRRSDRVYDDSEPADGGTAQPDAGGAPADGGSPTECDPGRQVGCTCADGRAGKATCVEDGSRFGVCVCDASPVCSAGASEPCTCADGATGTRQCSADGSAWGACRCGSGTPRMQLCVTSPAATRRCWSPGSGVSPPGLDFGQLRSGEAREGLLEVTNEGSGVLDFSVALAAQAGFSLVGAAADTLLAGESGRVTVRFAAAAAGRFGGDLGVVANDPRAAEVALPLSANVSGESARLCVEPASGDFGTVSVGSSATLPVTFTNCGDTSLEITNLTLQEDDASTTEFAAGAVTLPRTLGAGRNFVLDLVYTPRRATSGAGDTGSLSWASSAGNGSLRLTGRATDGSPAARLRIELSWAEAHGDLDLHYVGPDGTLFDKGSIFAPGGSDCFSSTCQPGGETRLDWGLDGTTDGNDIVEDDPVLDDDVRWGLGPETITQPQPFAGTYSVHVVHYCSRKWFQSSQSYASTSSGPNSASVKVFVDGALAGTFSRTLTQRDVWNVATVTVSQSGAINVTAANDVTKLTDSSDLYACTTAVD